MNSTTILGVLVLIVGIFLFLFVSIGIGLILTVVGLIIIYFGRRSAARLKQMESTGSPPNAPTSTVVVE